MNDPHHLNRMIRPRELPQYVGLRRTQIDELRKAGKFPQPVPLNDSGRAIAWLECDLVAWQAARISARNSSIAERNEAKGHE
jgi:prophage regulatory protein